MAAMLYLYAADVPWKLLTDRVSFWRRFIALYKKKVFSLVLKTFFFVSNGNLLSICSVFLPHKI